MAFDIEGARKAGYSNAEIADFLGAQRNFDVAKAREAGYSNEEILGHLLPPERKQSSITGELVRGGKQLYSTSRTAIESLFGSPEEAARAGLQRGQEISEAAGEGPSLERLKRVYEEKGLVSAGRQALSDVPKVIAGQAGTLGTAFAGGRLGAMVGAPLGPVGALVGGGLGAAASLIPSLMGANVERQAEAQQAAGQPVSPDVGKAALAATGQAALEVAGPAMALGKRTISSLLGITPAQLTTDAARAKLVQEASRTLAGGAARGIAAELPVELAQTVIERAQAGLDVLSDDALKEYGETAYATGIVGGALGGAGAAHGRGAARRQLEALTPPPAPTAETPPAPEALPAPAASTLAEMKPSDMSMAQLYQEEARLSAMLDENRKQPAVVERIKEVRALRRQGTIADIEARRADMAARSTEAAKAAESVFGQPELPEITPRAELGTPEAAAPEVAPEAPTKEVITREMLAEAGIKHPTKWMQENLIGKSADEVRALVEAQPNLLKTPGKRADFIRQYLAPTPPPFEEAAIGRPVEPGVPAPVDVVAGRRQPSVDVPAQGVRGGEERAAAPAVEEPVVRGVEPAGVPAAPRTEPEGAAPAPVAVSLKPYIAPERDTPATEKAAAPYMQAMQADNAAPTEFPQYLGWDMYAGSSFDRQSGALKKLGFSPSQAELSDIKWKRWAAPGEGATASQARRLYNSLTPEAQAQVRAAAENHFREAQQAQQAQQTGRTINRAQKAKREETVDFTGLEEDYGLDILAERAGRRPTVTETKAGRKVSGIRYQEANLHDPSPEEARRVEAGLAGKTPIEAADWLVQNAPNPDQSLIAERVSARLKALERAGVKFSLKIAHIGDSVPRALVVARGIAHAKFKPGESSVDIWLNGADVTGKVGVSYETVLHELVHAATMSAVRVGNLKLAADTELGRSVQSLYDVSNAIIRHFNARAKDEKSLTDFEKQVLNRNVNALANPDEILAWGLTNRDMQTYLESIPYQGKSLWTKFVEAIRNFLGLSPKADTALSEVLRVADTLLSGQVNQLETIAQAAGTGMQVQAAINEQTLLSGNEIPLTQETINELEKGDVADALNELRQSTKNPAYAAMAKRLMQLLGNTKVTIEPKLINAKGVRARGAASTSGRRIWLDRDLGLNEETLLHESVHAATEAILDKKPADRTAQQNVAIAELNKLWEAAKADANIELSEDAQNNLSEFATEALTNPKLVEQLKAKPWTISNAWEQFKKILLKMLGVQIPANMYEASVASMDTIFTAPEALRTAKAAEKPAQFTTPAFKKWFKNSKVVDANGNPLVVYHGTLYGEISKFNTGAKLPRTRPYAGDIGAWFSSTPEATEYFSGVKPGMRTTKPGGATYPVYLSITNPKEFNSYSDFTNALATYKTATAFKAALQKQGFDGMVVRGSTTDFGGMRDDWVAFRPEQIKSAIGNRGTFDPTNPDIRYRLAPTVEAALKSQDVRESKTVAAVVKGAFQKTLGFPGALNNDIVGQESKIRTILADKAATVFDTLMDGVNKGMISEMESRMTQAQFKQAEASDQLIPAFVRFGKIVFDKIGLWRAVEFTAAEKALGRKPPSEVLPMVKAWGEKNGLKFDDAWEYAARLIESGRQHAFREHNRNLKPGDVPLPQTRGFPIDELYAAYKADNDLLEIKRVLDDARMDMIDHMVKVGRISKDTADIWKDAAEYVPFDRLVELAKTFRPQKKVGRGLSALGKLPELVEAMSVERPVGNALDNYFNTLGWMLQQTVQTSALNNTLAQLEKIGVAKSRGFNYADIQNRSLAVRGFKNGQDFWYELPTIYHAAAFNTQAAPVMGFLKVFSAISRILRTSITALPTFTASQLPQDIQRAIIYSGVKDPAALTARALKEFNTLMRHAVMGTLYKATPEESALGIYGDVDFRKFDPATSIAEEFGYTDRTKLGSKKFGKLLHRLNEVSRASDIAIRKAIYDQTLLETKDELLAATRAREIINFRTTGMGDPLHILPFMTQTIPFFNAYVQGLDVLYRSFTGRQAVSGLEAKAARFQFAKMAGALIAGSTLYALMMAGDDDYEKMDLRKRDRSWILGGGVALPVPSEIGILFKALPERALEAMRKYGTPDERAGMIAISSWFQAAGAEYFGRLVPVPAAVKPILESWTNYSFRTGRPLEGIYQEGLKTQERVTGTTSEFAKEVSRFIYATGVGQMLESTVGVKLSPIKIDNAFNGYLGTTAALGLAMTDALMNPDKMDRPLHQMVGLTPFTYNPVGSRDLTDFYNIREKVVTAQTTLNTLMKQDPARAREFAEEHRDELMLYKTVNATLKELQNTRAFKQALNTSAFAEQMSSEERLKKKQEIEKYEQNLVGWIKMVSREI